MKIQNHPWSWGLFAGLVVWLVAVVATCVSCATVKPKPIVEEQGFVRTPQEQLGSTYRVLTVCIDKDGSGAVKGGSAVMLDVHHLLTAHHVVECDGLLKLGIEAPDGTRFMAHLQRSWEERDIALLYTLDAMPGRPAKLGTAKKGDAVCAHSAFPAFGAACGEVSDIWLFSKNANVQVTIPVVRGNSGGGVYVDGVLVGITTHFMRCLPNPMESCGGYASSLEGIR